MIKKNSEDSQYGIFRNKKNGKSLIFYPCPKNANSSAKLFFAKHLNIENKFLFLSDSIPEYKLSEKNFNEKINLINFLPVKQKFKPMPDSFIKCCLTRDPISRFKSAYKNRILFHKDEAFKDYSVDQVLESLENNNFANKHFLSQTYFLGNDLKYYDFTCDVKDIKLFEKFINIFFEKEILFPQIQIGGSKFDVKLSDNQIITITKIYKDDYEMLKSNS